MSFPKSLKGWKLRKKGKSHTSDKSSSDNSGDSEEDSEDSDSSTFSKVKHSVLVAKDKLVGTDSEEKRNYMERLITQRSIYNKERRHISMEQITRMMTETKTGFIMYDILGNEHMVTLKKSSASNIKSLKVKRGRGLDGKSRLSMSILDEAPNIFPRSYKHFGVIMDEQIGLASKILRIGNL